MAFEVDAEANLLALQEELRAQTYRPGQSICFVTEGHKPREVFAADFRDRIVHHLLVYHQERRFEPVFIHDSFACRRGKGALAASDRLMTFLRRVTANGRRPAWTIHLDVASFFPSIHKATLFELLCRRIEDARLRWPAAFACPARVGAARGASAPLRLGLTAGFPVWRAAQFAERALCAGVALVRPRRPARSGAVDSAGL